MILSREGLSFKAEKSDGDCGSLKQLLFCTKLLDDIADGARNTWTVPEVVATHMRLQT